MDFYLGCLLMGGPRLADYVAVNLFEPHIDTILKVRCERRIQYCLGISPKNFENAASIYSKIMPTLSCDAVPSLAAEDETACIQEARWVNMGHLRDTILGFCGEKSVNHKCSEDIAVVFGNDPGAYERIKEAFDKNVVSSMIRVIMINPLHPLLPPLVVLAMPTCNKFDNLDIQRQWNTVERLYDKYLKPVHKGNFIGHSSDGDSRRRKLMYASAKSTEGDRFRPIGLKDGFLFSVPTLVDGNGRSKIKDLFDQDGIHKVKKLLNPLDHANRILHLGPNHMAHMSHLKRVTEVFKESEHSLRKTDIERRDRQNFESVQRICFKKVRDCLDMLIDGKSMAPERPPESCMRGTREYLLLISNYLDFYFNEFTTLKEKVTKASFVINFIELWRKYISQSKNLSLKENFLTRECYIDCLLSCHACIILISFLRDNHPDLECRLDKTGSECVEDFFSMNGSWVVNKHTYSFADMFQI